MKPGYWRYWQHRLQRIDTDAPKQMSIECRGYGIACD